MKRFFKLIIDAARDVYDLVALALTWPRYDRADLTERDSKGE